MTEPYDGRQVTARALRSLEQTGCLLITLILLQSCSGKKSPYSPPVQPTETLDVAYSGSAFWAGLWDIAVADGYAYLAVENGVEILDVSNVAAPILISHVYLPCEAIHVAADVGYVYVASMDHLSIIDATIPSGAHVVAELNASLDGGLAVRDGYAYLASGAGLIVLNVANPAAPVIARSLEDGCYSPRIEGNHLFTTGYPGLQVYDISAPDDPRKVATLNVQFAQNLAVRNGMAAIWSSYCAQEGPCWSRTTLVDVSNPESPAIAGTYPPDGFGDFIPSMALGFVNGRLIQTSGGGVAVLDISEPESARVTGSLGRLWGNRSCLAVSGEILFTPSVRIVSVANPATPTEIGRYDMAGAGRVTSAGQTLLVPVGDGLAALDSDVPCSLVERGRIRTNWDCANLDADSNYAYLVDIGLTIVDITNPDAPTIIGSCSTPLAPRDVAVNGDYAYIADGTAGLLVLDIEDRRAPRIIHTVEDLGEVTDVALFDHFACVTAYGGDFIVVDVADPPHAAPIGSTHLAWEAWALDICEPHAFVANGIAGLQVVDLTDPRSPVAIATLDTELWAMDVTVSGSYAYIANSGFLCREGGLFIADISDPVAPFRAGHFDSPGLARGVAVRNDCVYLTDVTGLLALRVTPK